jgi:hypothetical protein
LQQLDVASTLGRCAALSNWVNPFRYNTSGDGSGGRGSLCNANVFGMFLAALFASAVQLAIGAACAETPPRAPSRGTAIADATPTVRVSLVRTSPPLPPPRRMPNAAPSLVAPLPPPPPPPPPRPAAAIRDASVDSGGSEEVVTGLPTSSDEACVSCSGTEIKL